MKINYFVFLFAFLCLKTMAQEKLLNEAVKNGVQNNGTYLIDNTKNKKFIDADKLQESIRQKGYIVGKITYQKFLRFGLYQDNVKTAEFFSPTGYSQYVFNVLSGRKTNYGQLKSSGIMFLPYDKNVYVPANNVISVYAGKQIAFTRYNNVLWSGEISYGLIHGSGVGYIASPQTLGTYMLITGTFSMGIPTSNISLSIVTIKDLNRGQILDNEITHQLCNSVSLRGLLQNREAEDSKLKEAIKYRLTDRFEYDLNVKKLEAVYNKIKYISVSNYQGFNNDGFTEDFIAFYETSGYDPQKMLPKAHEILDLYPVIDALRMEIRKSYYGVTLRSVLNQSYNWFENDEQMDRDCLRRGEEIARKRKNDSQYGFKQFFGQAHDEIDKKYSQFLKRIDSDIEAYNKYVENKKTERNRYDYEHRADIDWNRSKEPSGKLVSGIFDTYSYHSDEGVIYFKVGSDRVTYNIYYRDSKGTKFDHYSIIYSSDNIRNNLKEREFKSKGEMIEAIINAKR